MKIMKMIKTMKKMTVCMYAWLVVVSVAIFAIYIRIEATQAELAAIQEESITITAHAFSAAREMLDLLDVRVSVLESAYYAHKNGTCHPHIEGIIKEVYSNDSNANSFVEYDVFASLILQESGCDPLARSYKGALGLGQLMPSSFPDYTGDELLDVYTNLRLSLTLINTLAEKYGIRDALTAYHWGERRLKEGAYDNRFSDEVIERASGLK